MKKSLLILGLMVLTASFANACDCGPNCKCNPCKCPPAVNRPQPPRMDMEKLKLTDEQKAKAREIRMNGHKEIKPLFEQMQSKQEQKRALINSTITQKEQVEMIEKLNVEIVSLKRQIHELKIKNMKEFESILTDKQKKTLDKLKQDARKDFKKHHKPCTPACKCPCHK